MTESQSSAKVKGGQALIRDSGRVTEDVKLSRREIGRLVHDWIGVDGGYLGDFSYAKHDRFWLDVCDKYVDTNDFDDDSGMLRGDARGRMATEQAAALRAVLDDYPLPESPDPARPKFRSTSLHDEIVGWISRLRPGKW